MAAPALIRQATAADVEAVAAAHVASWRAAYAGLLPDEVIAGRTLEDRLRVWGGVVRERRGTLLVAAPDDTVLGFCHAWRTRDDDLDPSRVGEISALYLLPEAWGRGLGAALCDGALDALAREGLAEVALWVLESNARARAFYERAGFQPDGRRSEFVPGAADLRYRRFLPG